VVFGGHADHIQRNDEHHRNLELLIGDQFEEEFLELDLVLFEKNKTADEKDDFITTCVENFTQIELPGQVYTIESI
jgi:hypothetical protein